MNARPPHSNTDEDLFMAHMLRCMPVARQAISDLKLTYFYDGAETPYKLIWDCAQTFWRDNGMREIPVEHMYAALQQRMHDLPEFDQASMRDNVLQTAYRIYCVPSGSLIEAEGMKQLDDFVLLRAASPMLREALETGPEGIRSFIDALKQMGVSDTPKVAAESVKPFTQQEVKLGVEPREPCGVNFVDLLLAGGPRPKEVYGLLGMSGGGKTTLSNQIAIGAARHQRRMAVFTYEEPPTPEYFVPVYACASGVNREELEKLGPGSTMADLPEDTRKQVQESMGSINDWLEFFDMSGTGGRGSRGIPEIESLLDRRAMEGNPVNGVIIDWFWPMVVRFFNRSAGTKFSEERYIAQKMCDDIKDMAARQNIWVVVNQQLAPSEGSSNKKKAWHNSAELKSFAWYFNGCFVLEPLSDQNMSTLHLSKGRSIKTNSIHVKLEGERATFVAPSGDLIYDKKLGEVVERGQQNNVPTVEEEPSLEGISITSYDDEEFGDKNG